MSNSLQLVLLPGFDGTGDLFAPLQAALGSDVPSTAVRYDSERSLEDYMDSVARILPHENAVLVAESFSGPVALSLLARYPARIKYAVLCATFAVSPFRSLTRVARYGPTFLFTPTRMQGPLLRTFCLNGERDDALVDRAASVVRSMPAASESASSVRRRYQGGARRPTAKLPAVCRARGAGCWAHGVS